jgi:hypothetical protein
MAPTVKNCMDINNANCDLGMMGDVNMVEHFNQTTKPPLQVNKAEKIRITMKFSEKQLIEKKRCVIEETKDDTSKDDYDAGREDNEGGKTGKENIGAPHSE